MAEVTFPLPDLGEGLISAKVLEWLVAEGDFVERNAPLIEVETAKAAVEIPSPRSGRILRLHAAEDDELAVGDPLVTFAVEDGGIVGTVPRDGKPARRVHLTPPQD